MVIRRLRETRIERAFSMAELLVIVAVVIIIFATLQPVLIQARTAAYLHTSRMNLRQLGQAIHLYGQDYNDGLPQVADYASLRDFPHVNECHTPEATTSLDGALMRYVRSRQVFYAPLDRWHRTQAPIGDVRANSYGHECRPRYRRMTLTEIAQLNPQHPIVFEWNAFDDFLNPKAPLHCALIDGSVKRLPRSRCGR